MDGIGALVGSACDGDGLYALTEIHGVKLNVNIISDAVDTVSLFLVAVAGYHAVFTSFYSVIGLFKLCHSEAAKNETVLETEGEASDALKTTAQFEGIFLKHIVV